MQLHHCTGVEAIFVGRMREVESMVAVGLVEVVFILLPPFLFSVLYCK